MDVEQQLVSLLRSAGENVNSTGTLPEPFERLWWSYMSTYNTTQQFPSPKGMPQAKLIQQPLTETFLPGDFILCQTEN